ncbi:MAG: hypothetical protein FWE24_05555 [Defluviitaleaceae bacterium]|nr:hypothetical protein [Defluviitaleaceae bacterium]
MAYSKLLKIVASAAFILILSSCAPPSAQTVRFNYRPSDEGVALHLAETYGEGFSRIELLENHYIPRHRVPRTFFNERTNFMYTVPARTQTVWRAFCDTEEMYFFILHDTSREGYSDTLQNQLDVFSHHKDLQHRIYNNPILRPYIERIEFQVISGFLGDERTIIAGSDIRQTYNTLILNYSEYRPFEPSLGTIQIPPSGINIIHEFDLVPHQLIYINLTAEEIVANYYALAESLLKPFTESMGPLRTRGHRAMFVIPDGRRITYSGANGGELWISFFDSPASRTPLRRR